MAASFQTILLSRPFKFFIGRDALEILIHEEAIASQSPALNKLMRGEMSEGKTGEVTWADVDQATFTRFTQFAYTGDYSVPKMVVTGQTQQKQVGVEASTQFEEDNLIEGSYLDNWPTSHSSSLKKIKKSKNTDLFDFGENTCDPVIVSGSEETIIEALLTHTSLYILAEKWGISSLKRLTLFKLDQTLSMLKLNAKVPRIVKLVRHGYAGTPDLETGIDDLRKLVCQYIAANVKVMSKDKTFQAFIEEGGAFMRDLWKRVLPRVG